jgi:hypothetical protein
MGNERLFISHFCFSVNGLGLTPMMHRDLCEPLRTLRLKKTKENAKNAMVRKGRQVPQNGFRHGVGFRFEMLQTHIETQTANF